MGASERSGSDAPIHESAPTAPPRIGCLRLSLPSAADSRYDSLQISKTIGNRIKTTIATATCPRMLFHRETRDHMPPEESTTSIRAFTPTSSMPHPFADYGHWCPNRTERIWINTHPAHTGTAPPRNPRWPPTPQPGNASFQPTGSAIPRKRQAFPAHRDSLRTCWKIG